MAIVLLESILLSLGGGIAGILLGHSIVAISSPLLVDYTGVTVGFWQFDQIEVILIPALIVLASIVGYLPAVSAYRTDVAKGLADNP